MKYQPLKFSVLFVSVVVSFMFISWDTIKERNEPKKSIINTLTKAEIKEGWKLLFDGKTFNGWRGLGRDHIPNGLWTIEDGQIKKVNTGEVEKLPDGRPVEGGDLMTKKTFENFELSFEWKINKSGNSGLKYNVSEDMSQKYGSKYSALGFEYQLLDDGDEAYKGKLKPSQFSGSLYDLLPAKNIVLKPVGEFNCSRILVDGNHAEHWLNGMKVLEFEFGSKELDEAYTVSKFNKIPGFQDKHKGHIVLQNHNDESWFRNIKIREFKN
ncbi:MAG TPA: DUF1080 domain-containing protein [Prolixibacteraceae bacterium]|nr:DUF1080 domain-containing protein [Prolixibacteraceae bacterium]